MAPSVDFYLGNTPGKKAALTSVLTCTPVGSRKGPPQCFGHHLLDCGPWRFAMTASSLIVCGLGVSRKCALCEFDDVCFSIGTAFTARHSHKHASNFAGLCSALTLTVTLKESGFSGFTTDESPGGANQTRIATADWTKWDIAPFMRRIYNACGR